MDSISKINKLCKSVLNLTEEDFKEIDKMIEGQKNYMNPLRMAKQIKMSMLAKHNTNVVAALRNLHKVLLDGAESQTVG